MPLRFALGSIIGQRIGNVARIRTSGNGSFTGRNLGLYFANSQKLLITTDKVMFSADAKVDTTNQRDLGAAEQPDREITILVDV